MKTRQEPFSINKWDFYSFEGNTSDKISESAPMKTNYEASCFNDLMACLRLIYNVYSKYEAPAINSLWYRGHSNSAYNLLPTLIREYYGHNCKSSLPDYQRKMLEYFLTATRNSPELGNAYFFGNMQIENLSEMQHYHIPTNLLDWSEDPMVGLYFACFKKDDTLTAKEAAVFVLNPYVYNAVRGELIRYFIGNISVVNGDNVQRDNYLTAPYLSENLIPNFRAAYNLAAGYYTNYIFGPDHYHSLKDTNYHYDSNPLQNPSKYRNSKSPLFPIAVLIPKGNPHMVAQSGTFMAYNLCEMPIKEPNMQTKDAKHLYPHIDLEKIQEFYFSDAFQTYIKGGNLAQQLERTNSAKVIMDATPFLFKITLNVEAVKEYAEQVKIMGKRWDTIYPDLVNIGKNLANYIRS